jgi:hypothetical protein
VTLTGSLLLDAVVAGVIAEALRRSPRQCVSSWQLSLAFTFAVLAAGCLAAAGLSLAVWWR